MGYDDTCEAKIRAALAAWDMPTAMDYPKAELMRVAASDKKRAGDEIRFIFIERIGRSIIRKLPLSELEAVL